MTSQSLFSTLKSWQRSTDAHIMYKILVLSLGAAFFLLAVSPGAWKPSKNSEEGNFIMVLCTSARRVIPRNSAVSNALVSTQQNFMFVCANAHIQSPLSPPETVEETCSCLYNTAKKSSTEKVDFVKTYIRILRSEQPDAESDKAVEAAGVATFVPALSACSL